MIAHTQNLKKNIGAVLGPFIENEKLLEGLERKIGIRIRDLHKALEKLKQNNSKILENNAVIKQQNHIFLSFFETSTSIHDFEELHELFADTLNQLRYLRTSDSASYMKANGLKSSKVVHLSVYPKKNKP